MKEDKIWKCPKCNEVIEGDCNIIFVLPGFMDGGEAYFDLEKEQRYHEECYNGSQ